MSESEQVRGLRANDVVADRYRLLHVLGQGTFGQVWLVHDAHNDVERALKVVQRPEFAASIRREARRLGRFERAQIDWQHLARLLEILPDETACLVYEYIAGPDLRDYVRERGGKLPLDAASAILLQVLDGVAEMHRAGVLHRDLHPGNIKVNREPPDLRIKLLDFGLSWPLPEQLGPGQLYGLSALSIEPVHPWAEGRRKPGILPDVRTDLYSAGALLWWLLTGREGLPEGQSLEQVAPAAPKAIRELIWRASLAPRTERFVSAAEVSRALHAATDRTAYTRPGPARSTLPSPPRAVAPAPFRRLRGVGKGGVRQIVPLLGDRALLLTQSDVTLWEGHGTQQRWLIEAPFRAGAVSRDETLMALANETDVSLWNLQLVEPIAQLKPQPRWVQRLAFSPDGALIATSSGEKRVQLWDVASGTEVRALRAGAAQDVQLVAPLLAFSPDGRTIAACDGWSVGDGIIQIWDVASGAEFPSISTGHRTPTGIGFGVDGSSLAVGMGFSVQLYDPIDGKELRRLTEFWLRSLRSKAVATSADGTLLAFAGAGSVRVWDIAAAKVIQRLGLNPVHMPGQVAFSPDGVSLGLVTVAGVALICTRTPGGRE